MRLLIFDNYKILSYWAADYVKGKITENRKNCVLGLPTGSTPLGMYQNLVQFYKAKKISFKNVTTFNMDEYVGLSPDHPQSYHYFMHQNLFDHIDIAKENINILDGLAKDKIKEAQNYEDRIKKSGGIDLFIGGVGADGHLAFNEPGSSLHSRTREKTLREETVLDNARFFENDINKVPKTALSVGVGTVFDAKEIMLLVNGERKARALKHIIENGVNHMWTASILQLHPNALVLCDKSAANELKVKTYDYFLNLEKEAITKFENI